MNRNADLRGVRSERATYIIGAGHFGSRAAAALAEIRQGPVIVVDQDTESLEGLGGLPVRLVRAEGVSFLVDRFGEMAKEDLIIPAAPVHLAFLWLQGTLKGRFRLEQVPVPEGLVAKLPHVWPGSEGSVLVSYADFQCPDDCAEPEACTVTGERRRPLYDLLGALEVEGRKALLLRSLQMAPGVGGYYAGDLRTLRHSLVAGGEGPGLLATSCKCHGILTAFRATTEGGEQRGQDEELTCS